MDETESTERPDRSEPHYCDDRDIRFKKKTDMAEELKRDLIQTICDNQRSDHEEICTNIRNIFESRHGAYWSCVVDPRYIIEWNTPATYAHFTYLRNDFHFWRITH